jgi:putative N6-adenine-specific DNA methylase
METVSATKCTGGFELTSSWEKGRGLAHLLKIPTRILVRLTEVTARDFPKLFQKTRDLSWTKWISHPEVQWKVSAHSCRLMHTGRLEEVLREALAASFARQPLSTRYQKEDIPPDTVYVRGVEDKWTFSLDLCGEALYKRGISTVKGPAPLRETLASAALFWFLGEQEEPVTLWDPMCGSGTFLFEATHFHLPSPRSLKLEKSILNLGVLPWKPYAPVKPFALRRAMGSDVNQELISKLSGDFFVEDFLQAHPRGEKDLWIICNPPYGDRLELKVSGKALRRQFLEALDRQQAQQALLVIPQDWGLLSHPNYLSKSVLNFSHGGLWVQLLHLKRVGI